ncbi:MAG: hypothetical protein JWM53_7064 [bacterium]|nr:hypothetical protein [bacterium]
MESLGGGAADVRSACARLRTLLDRQVVIVELAGARRSEPIAALFGARVLAEKVAASVTVRLRRADELTYEVRWPDGRTEASQDESAGMATGLAERERELADALVQAQASLEALQRARKERRAPEPVSASLVVTPPSPAAPRRSRLGALFARLIIWLRSLFTRPAPAALPSPAADASTVALPPIDPVLEIEARLAAADARAAALTAERDQRQRELASYAIERCQRILARLQALTASPAPRWTELHIGAPEIPAGFVLVLRPTAGEESEPLDATLLTSPDPSASSPDERPWLRLQEPRAPAELLRQLERVRGDRPAAIARRVAAALCMCRNRIVDVDARARSAHDERVRELAAHRVADREALRQREESAAQLPVARQVEQIVHDAAARLERLLEEVRAAWEERVNGCAGIEQLRTEVAAVENGAAHRLSLVCDELRENMTVQFVRLVLERSRSLGQELLRKRLEVARGRSPQLEQAFEDIRVALPGSLDATFGALQAPGVGELLRGERGLFDPLFRTLAREKRDCIVRLGARLDEIAATTARDLFAAAVYVSPLVMTTFNGLVTELITAHERWIDTRAAEEELAWEKARARHAPALELVAPLEQQESQIARLLESAAG